LVRKPEHVPGEHLAGGKNVKKTVNKSQKKRKKQRCEIKSVFGARVWQKFSEVKE